MQRNTTREPEPVIEKYPYVSIEQLERRYWKIRLAISPNWYEYHYSIKYAHTKEAAERKGRRMLNKYNKKYSNLADPYRIR